MKRQKSTAQLQAKTLRHADRHGLAWTDDEVSVLANEIEKDSTTFDMAMALGRSYYSVMAARTHVRFALNHQAVLYRQQRVRAAS